MQEKNGTLGGKRMGRTKLMHSKKICSNVTFFITNSTRTDLGQNLSHRGEKPATNCMSYGNTLSDITNLWLHLHMLNYNIRRNKTNA
jgi:hypothetical protein